MFKNIRKLTAILLASILCLTSMTTVFAEGDKGDAGEPVGVSIEEVEKLTPSSSANKNAITASPEAATVKAGETAVFTVATSGKVRSYQWQVSKNGGKTWSKLSGKTKDTLKVGDRGPQRLSVSLQSHLQGLHRREFRSCEADREGRGAYDGSQFQGRN